VVSLVHQLAASQPQPLTTWLAAGDKTQVFPALQSGPETWKW